MPPGTIALLNAGSGRSIVPTAPHTTPVITPVTMSFAHSRLSNWFTSEIDTFLATKVRPHPLYPRPCLFLPMTANDDHAVREAFARWVAGQPGAPRDPES